MGNLIEKLGINIDRNIDAIGLGCFGQGLLCGNGRIVHEVQLLSVKGASIDSAQQTNTKAQAALRMLASYCAFYAFPAEIRQDSYRYMIKP
jgi:hypothetical protein